MCHLTTWNLSIIQDLILIDSWMLFQTISLVHNLLLVIHRVALLVHVGLPGVKSLLAIGSDNSQSVINWIIHLVIARHRHGWTSSSSLDGGTWVHLVVIWVVGLSSISYLK